MNRTNLSQNRLIIVSNRLPVILEKGKEDEWEIKSGSGGLVTALAPVLKNRGGIWIGWPGHIADNNESIDNILNEHN